MFGDILKRKLKVMDLFSYGWEIAIKNLKFVLLYLLVSFIFSQFLTVPLFTFISLGYMSSITEASITIITLFVAIFAIIGNLWIVMVIAQISEDMIREGKIDIVHIMKKALRRLPSALTTNILLFAIVAITLIFFILPGIYFANLYFATTYVVMLRKRSGREALQYSSKLVKNNWLRVFAILVLFNLLSRVLNNGVTTYLTGSLVGNLIGVSLLTFIGFYFLICRIILFLNLDYLKYSQIKPDIMHDAPWNTSIPNTIQDSPEESLEIEGTEESDLDTTSVELGESTSKSTETDSNVEKNLDR